MHTSSGGPLTAQCLTDASTDETLGKWIDVRGYAHLVFYCTSTGTGVTSSGVISLEEAGPIDASVNPNLPFPGDTGKFSVITTKNASDFTGLAQVAVHPTVSAYCFVRARVSTAIGGGGTVSVSLVAY